MPVEFTIDDIFGDSLNLRLDNETIEDAQKAECAESTPSTNKLIKVTDKGVSIINDELMDKIKKKNLSASMVSSFFQCPADWVMDNFILPKLDHEEPIYFVRGKIFHDTMERFFALDPEERTPKILSKTALELIKDKYKESLEDPETMEWVRTALKGYLEAEFPYKDVNVARIPKKVGGEPELGVELFVKGKLGNTERQVVGFVDRIDELPDGRLQVVDYKTGKKISPFDPNQPISDSNDFGYWRQQLAYSMLLEQAGHKVGGALLEFPIAKGAVKVDVENEELRKQVERDFEAVDSALTKCIEDNLFPFHGHFFCKWCGMLSPDFTPSRFGKLDVSWEEVLQYVELQ